MDYFQKVIAVDFIESEYILNIGIVIQAGLIIYLHVNRLCASKDDSNSICR